MSSDKPVQYTWTKNGKPLTSNDVTIIDNVLIVTPRSEEDYGVYVCKATDSAGTAEYEMTLKEETKSSTNSDPAKGGEGKLCLSHFLSSVRFFNEKFYFS